MAVYLRAKRYSYLVNLGFSRQFSNQSEPRIGKGLLALKKISTYSGAALVSGALLWIAYEEHRRMSSVHALTSATAKIRSKDDKKIGSTASLSQLTSRERRFVQFASNEFRGQLYMTPQDFLESVIEGEPRPRLKRRNLQEQHLVALQKTTPPLSQGNFRTFRDLGERGLISYTEYLFLLSILTKPKSGFHIAFNMFDTDGNAQVDKQEFMVLLGILCQKIFKEDIIRGIDQELLERIFSHAYRDRRGLAPPVSDQEGEMGPTAEGDGLLKRNDFDTTLLLHLFGRDGNLSLSFDDFARFMQNLQTEVLELEFQEFSKGLSTITEQDFAKILLRYTQLDTARYDEFLERLIQGDPEEKGITFPEFHDFCTFLNNLDDFAIAMKMYTLADRSVSESEFQRAVKICTGASLSQHVVRIVFLIFDQDGDGRLSDREFIAIMRDRIHRGLQSHSRNEGWDAFKHCVKQEIKSLN
ncbi:calcium uptake protein 3, mitochondrial isoform X1 [Daphnia magna]|uniref:calcium uptake protein 3, mitochondrial isoform X1 n=1 Tax=Daphnia magna TaxID=35525 RepID=UPI001E1BC161|nr:calcium uptake protein 3, mitochondrial isoform X1 [Daphnia magna]